MSAIRAQHEDLLQTWRDVAGFLTQVWAVLCGEVAVVPKEQMKNKIAWRQMVLRAVGRYDFSVCYINYTVRSLGALCKELLSNDCEKILALCESDDTAKLFRAVSNLYGRFRLLQNTVAVIMNPIDAQVIESDGRKERRRIPITAEDDHRRSLDTDGLRSVDANSIVCYTTKERMIRAFREVVYDRVKKKLMDVVVRVVNSGRMGDRINKEELQNAVSVFHDIGSSMDVDAGISASGTGGSRRDDYKADFEDTYVEVTVEFYAKESASYLARDPINHHTYLQWCDARFKYEMALCIDLFPTRKGTHERIEHAMIRTLLEPRVDFVVTHPESGFRILLVDKKMTEIRYMAHMMAKVPMRRGLEVMAAAFGAHLTDKGREVFSARFKTLDPVADAGVKGDRIVIANLIELLSFGTKFVVEYTDNDPFFRLSMQNAMQTVVNEPLERPEIAPGSATATVTRVDVSVVLCNCVDSLLRGEYNLGSSDEDTEMLGAMATLFSFIREKDVFQEIYKSKLARRLLTTTPNDDLEKFFLQKLTWLMSKSFTHKMQAMITDCETTRKMSDRFRESATVAALVAGDVKLDFDVQVLAAGSWPSYKSDTHLVPPIVKRYLQAFTDFYRHSAGHTSRALSWIHVLSSGVLNIRFPKGTKEVNGNAYQASILSIVDDQGSVSVGQLITLIGLDGARVVKPQIATMYLSKQFPLLCLVNEAGDPQETGRGIGDGDRLAINREFTHKMRKFKLPVPTAGSREGAPSDTELDSRRKVQVDACIVRVMKSRRTLHYTELLDLVIQQLSTLFTLQPKLIKQCVEDLITRAYLKRDAGDSAKFEYLS